MATRTLDQNVGTLNLNASATLRSVGLRVRDGMRASDPYGRRYAVTGIGAACALGLGVMAALLVQLPPEMRDPVQVQDQTLAQTELPSEAQARANALNNPPAFAAPEDHRADVAPPPDPFESTTADLDEKPTGPTVTTNTTDDDEQPTTTPTETKPSDDPG